MRSLVCLVILAAIVCATRVPDQDDEHGVTRVRRSDPWNFFNTNTNKKKKNKKIAKTKPPPPKPTTQAPTTLPPVITTATPSIVSDQNKMPEYIKAKMGKLKTEAEVKRFLGVTGFMSQKIDAVKRTLNSSAGFGQSSGSNANSRWMTSTECMSRPQVIRFPQPDLYHGVIYPLCGMAKRCGGCCFVDMHRCVPDNVKNELHPVYYIPYNAISSQRNSRKKRSPGPEFRFIPVENHLSCKCQCKVRPEDCDSRTQYHHESTCQCKCKDSFTSSRLNCVNPFRYDKATCSCKCAYHHKHCPVAKQHWDNKLCKCKCDSGIKCPMGQVINKNSCECEDIQMSDKRLLPKKSNSC